MNTKVHRYGALYSGAFRMLVGMLALFGSFAIRVDCAAAAQAGGETPPVVLWASDPVRGGEAVMVLGDGLAGTTRIEVLRWADPPPGQPGADPFEAESPGTVVEPLQLTDQTLKFVLPEAMPMGVYAVRITNGAGVATCVLNRPTITWLIGDEGPQATTGGRVRLFGRCLSLAKEDRPTVQLRGAHGDIGLKPDQVGPWSVAATLPDDLPPGRYQVFVHNGCGGPAGWSEPVSIEVGKKCPWPDTVYNVQDFGAARDDEQDDTDAIQAALNQAGENGGGVVYLPRGRYRVSRTLEIPPNVTLRGQRREWVALYWPDTDTPPTFLVHGTRRFAVEDVTIYCNNYVHAIGNDVDDPEAGDVHIRRIRVRAVLYRGHFSPDEVNERFKSTLKLSTGGGDTIRLRGPNVEVVDSDLYGSGRVLFLLRGRGARIQRNTMHNGRWGWYCISGADGVVFEENQLSGGDLMSTGGGINCLYGVSWSQNVHYANNRLGLLHGWDREAMTSDAGGGAYAGPLAKADRQSVTLAEDPDWGQGRDWTGTAVFVLDGKGMGQYRRIQQWDGRHVQLDKPWRIIPDHTSTVSVTMLQRNYCFIDNEFADASVAIQLYGIAIGHIMAGNRSQRTGGFHNMGLNYHGYQPSWFNQWLDNEILEGNVYQGGHNQHRLSGEAHLGVLAYPRDGSWTHPLALCTVVRRNKLLNNAHIVIGGSDPPVDSPRAFVRDVIVENNHIEQADRGVWIRGDAAGVLLRGNTTRDVRLPVVTREVLERIRAEERAKLIAQKQPIAHWSFDQVTGTTVCDQSPNRFTARVEGAVKFSPEGVRGQCAVFDGAGDLRVERGNRLQLETWTIAAWINPATVEGRSGIIAKRTANTAAPFVLGVRDGRLAFEGCNREGQWTFNFASDAQIQPDCWQHVAAVIEQGKGVKLYIDGRLEAENPVVDRLIQTDQNLWIGCDAWGGRPADVKTRGYFIGSLDEVKIWSRALSETDLQAEVSAANRSGGTTGS